MSASGSPSAAAQANDAELRGKYTIRGGGAYPSADPSQAMQMGAGRDATGIGPAGDNLQLATLASFQPAVILEAPMEYPVPRFPAMSEVPKVYSTQRLVAAKACLGSPDVQTPPPAEQPRPQGLFPPSYAAAPITTAPTVVPEQFYMASGDSTMGVSPPPSTWTMGHPTMVLSPQMSPVVYTHRNLVQGQPCRLEG